MVYRAEWGLSWFLLRDSNRFCFTPVATRCFPIAIIECLPPPWKRGCQTRNVLCLLNFSVGGKSEIRLLCYKRCLTRIAARQIIKALAFSVGAAPTRKLGFLCWQQFNAEDKVGVHYHSGKCSSCGCNMVTLWKWTFGGQKPKKKLSLSKWSPSEDV